MERLLTRCSAVWESLEALQLFETSTAYNELFHDLNCEKKPLFALQPELGFNLEVYLHGRITLTILHFQKDDKSLHTIPFSRFGNFVPADCEDLRGPAVLQRLSCAYSDPLEQPLPHPRTTGPVRGYVYYIFFRWIGGGATPERENASAHNPKARESWANKVLSITPPVKAWEQQRWHIRALPGFEEYISPLNLTPSSARIATSPSRVIHDKNEETRFNT